MVYLFGQCELDTELYELRLDGDLVSIEPQVFDVLRFLVENAGRLLTKDDFLEEVWEGRIVSESALTSRLKAARRAIGDSGSEQRFIKTIRGRGYRFVGEVHSGHQEPDRRPSARTVPDAPRPTTADVRAVEPPPGRASEMAALQECFRSALGGERQMVFVTGEAGMGKTTVVDAFAAWAAEQGAVVSAGQCLERLGPDEPYRPVFEVLTRICGGPPSLQALRIVATHAPTWLLQLPALAAELDIDDLRARAPGSGSERMLREVVQALEALGEAAPLILVFEDLHWADASTIDLLTHLQMRRDPARLMVVGTLRPDDADIADHPIAAATADLTLRRGAVQLDLSSLQESDVREIVLRELGATGVSREVVGLLWSRTAGLPLFVAAVLRAWRFADLLELHDGVWRPTAELAALDALIPTTLNELLEQRLSSVESTSRAILDAASAAGAEFDVAAVAAALDLEDDDVEERCELLTSRDGLLRDLGLRSWPDGTITARFGFRHDLYQRVLYGALRPSRRAKLHRAIAQRLEAGEAGTASERAGELAFHYEQGREPVKGAHFSAQAARGSLDLFAYREAMAHVRRGLALLPAVPSPGRERLEVDLQMAAAQSLTALEGYSAPATEAAYQRAQQLAEGLDDDELLGTITAGLCRHYSLRARFRAGNAEGRKLLELADRVRNPSLAVAGHVAIGTTALYLGELEDCAAHCRVAIDAIGRGRGRHGGLRPEALEGYALAQAHLSWADWMQGRLGAAFSGMDALLEAVEGAGDHFNHAFVLHHMAWLNVFDGRVDVVESTCADLLELSEARGLTQWVGAARCLHGWLRARDGDAGGVALVREGIEQWIGTRSRLGEVNTEHLYAEALLAVGSVEDALRTLDVAEELCGRLEERWYLARLQECRARAHAAAGDEVAAEKALQAAVDTALGIGAPMLALRALQAATDVASSALAGRLDALIAQLEVGDPGLADEARGLAD